MRFRIRSRGDPARSFKTSDFRCPFGTGEFDPRRGLGQRIVVALVEEQVKRAVEHATSRKQSHSHAFPLRPLTFSHLQPWELKMSLSDILWFKSQGVRQVIQAGARLQAEKGL